MFIADGAVEEKAHQSTGEPVEVFFARYEGFEYCPSAKPNEEFNRLGRMLNWERGDQQRSAAWRLLAAAMAYQFEGRYGSDVNDLGAWQRLCARIGISPIPTELEEAKKVSPSTSRASRSLPMVRRPSSILMSIWSTSRLFRTIKN